MLPEILTQHIEAHQLWLESRRVEGAQAVFQGQDLRFSNLVGKRLNDCVLAGANLERSDLRGVMLAGADLRKTNLAYADLTGADLAGANLSGARLDGALLDESDLREALIEDASFDSATMKNANLAAARGARAKFNRAVLSGADLDSTLLLEAQFNGATLTQASFRESNLDGAQFRGAAMSSAQFDGATLRDALLLDAILVGVSFDSANIEGARLDRNAMGGADPEDEDGASRTAKKTKKGAVATPFTGITLAPHERMAHLLQRRDEVQQSIRNHLIHADVHEDNAIGSAELQSLRAKLDDIEGDRRVVRQEIRRTDEHRRLAQAELENRVEAATQALRTALSSTNKQLRRAFFWSLLSKTFGLSLIGLGAAWLLLYMYRLNFGTAPHFAEWMGVGVGLFVIGTIVLAFDHFGRSDVQPLVARRGRIENVIATLNASPHLSVDVEINQSNILHSFDLAKDVLLGLAPNDSSEGK